MRLLCCLVRGLAPHRQVVHTKTEQTEQTELTPHHYCCLLYLRALAVPS